MTTRRNLFKGGALAAAAGMLGAKGAMAEEPPFVQRSFSGDKSFAANEPLTRPWTKPQRPTGPISIDMHNHWAPDVYLKAKAALGKPDFLDPSNHDLPKRVQAMNAMGIQMGVLTLGGFRPWQWVTAPQGAEIARGVNDAAMDAHKAFPKNLVAGIEVNCSDAVGSLAEFNRVAGKPGFVCLHLPTSLGGKEFMFTPEFEKIFARCNEMQLPVFLHPLDGQANWFLGERLVDQASGVAPGTDFNAGQNRFPGLTNSLGNTLETAVCLSKIISSGLLDKYENLTFIAAQGGGAFPFSAGRLENRGGGGQRKHPMGYYMRRFYYDSLVYYPESLRFLAEMVGVDRLCLGTDNMYAGANQMTGQPHSVIDQANFIDAEREMVLRGNLARLFKL